MMALAPDKRMSAATCSWPAAGLIGAAAYHVDVAITVAARSGPFGKMTATMGFFRQPLLGTDILKPLTNSHIA